MGNKCSSIKKYMLGNKIRIEVHNSLQEVVNQELVKPFLLKLLLLFPSDNRVNRDTGQVHYEKTLVVNLKTTGH